MNYTLRKKISKRIVLGEPILSHANLGKDVEIIVQNNSIIILPAIDEEGWEILENLGKNAVEGKLEDPSVNHDKYLYRNL